jgi:NAD(P)-dependent dehydrogenase (short-subunit alcohol dehydrogenase family)
MKSFSDCLRREMLPWNLRVVIIEPGALKTSMLDAYERTWRNLWSQLSTDVQQRWGIDYLNQIITRSVNSPFMTHADNPHRVVGAIRHALSSPTPWLRYRPGWQAKLFFYLLYLPPAWLIDLLLDKALNFRPSGVKDQLIN